MSNSGTFSASTVLCLNRLYLVPEFSHHAEGTPKNHYMIVPPTQCQPLGTIHHLSVSVGVTPGPFVSVESHGM